MKKKITSIIISIFLFCVLVPSIYFIPSSNNIVGASMTTLTNFSFVVLPDTQGYTQFYPTIFKTQTKWIVDNKDELNIVYVTGEGDITYDESKEVQWQRANEAYCLLENSTTTHLTYGIPYTIPPGNHDHPTTLFNQYFGVSRFSGRSYYGGHYSNNNNNHYVLFEASNLKFIAIALDYHPGTDVLNWADNLLKNYDDRRAIIVTHCILDVDAKWEENGQSIYDTLKDNTNLFLMLCGHMHGESRRTETYNGNTVNILLSDYQTYPNGGNGYLRIMTFCPMLNRIEVKTYSPYLDKYETDSNSQFNINYEMNTPLICNANGPYSGTVGQNIEFTSSVAGGTLPYTINWTFGDGQTSNYKNPVHNYTKPGNYSVILFVTDSTLSTTQDTTTVNINSKENHPPSAIDDTVIVLKNSSDNQINVCLNDYDVDGDTFTVTSVTTTLNGYVFIDRNRVFYTPNSNYVGLDLFTYSITDEFGESDIATVNITVNNIPDPQNNPSESPPPNPSPVAKISITEPYKGLVNNELTFDGSQSSDIDNDIITWIWDFGDNTTAEGQIVNHSFSDAGDYLVTLTVNDEDGPSDKDSTVCLISHSNRIPTNPVITGPTNGTKNLAYSYSILSTDEDNDSIQFNIYWGDSIPSESSDFLESGKAFTVNHSWKSAGRYDVTVNVTDNQTVASSTISIYIDSLQVGGIGYLIDNDSDITYDEFYSNYIKQITATQKKDGDYNIDTDGNGQWDFVYNFSSNKISYFASPIILQESNNFSTEIKWIFFVLMKWIFMALAAVTFLIIVFTKIFIHIKQKNIENKIKKLDYTQSKTNISYIKIKPKTLKEIENIIDNL